MLIEYIYINDKFYILGFKLTLFGSNGMQINDDGGGGGGGDGGCGDDDVDDDDDGNVDVYLTYHYVDLCYTTI